MITQVSHWPYVEVPCFGISQGYEISSGSGVQKSTGFCIIDDNVGYNFSVNNLCQQISIQQLRWHRIMFLSCQEICRRWVWMVFGKGESWALCTHTSSFPPTSIFSLSLDLRVAALSESPSSPWSWAGLSLQGPAGSCWSLQVPGRCLKIWGQTFHIPHCRIDVPLYCI